MNILMLSSSKFAQYEYLAYAQTWINNVLQIQQEVIFIPYAGVSIHWDAYTEKVQQALPIYKVKGIHKSNDPQHTIMHAKAILVGGGNTFNLLNELYKQKLLEPIRKKVQNHTPYIGWSAGSNICGMSISTTNDMPIIEPPSFAALNLINAQLNPHYTDFAPVGHFGETRDERLNEFCIKHPNTPVLAIKEGSALLVKDERMTLLGCDNDDDPHGFVFYGSSKTAINQHMDLSEYLQKR